MTWDAFFAVVGKAAVLLIPTAAFGLWFAKTYIDKWLASHFQSQLDALKHAQGQEVERLRAKIAGMLDRATKLHQHEFEVLPKIWDKLTIALGSSSALMASYREGVDPGAIGPEDLEVLLRESPLEEHQKAAVRNAGRFDKPKVYGDLMERYAFDKAHREAMAFHNDTIQFGIFIEPTIREKLKAASLALRQALRTWRHILQMPEQMPWPVQEAQDHLARAVSLSEEIDKLVTERLWNGAKLDI